ncbi:MAG: nicotinate phosphoribosyltransferase [Candidatus Parvarchaeota archaeon]|nr:nicotinate phosphoribosyltransferase [Candidatus Jingweiarchaeum tengchongense]MCW1298343.1 nicotinate phosphoribosyltransferase [Candidatus Jingweiarchaeum tengchongense]MCW1304720.1 nicotinate phosphoribosyltransferase [Candidatus Jingweiarchaeum tengchongense]MCW1310580.1 nicotinate phosphoribosyltransferase [Candidatus Jingweiarchaeum tengchongense]
MTLNDRLFWISKEEEIKKADTTDVYFDYAVKTLNFKHKNPRVVMEVYARKIPFNGNWAIVNGIYDVAKLLENLPVSVKSMREGEIFLVNSNSAVYEPVMQIEGNYLDFARYENAILGFLSASSGIATAAARIRLAAGDKMLFSFGTRRTHPALAPCIERAAYIGGFDKVSNVLGAKLLGQKPVGTMPHSLIQCFGNQNEAWKAFDEAMPDEIPRIILTDTYFDEKVESLMALDLFGNKLYGVRLDTISSRRGNFRKIIEEVRWELNARGAKSVKIFVSGGLDENSVRDLADIVDGFGVGTSVSNAPSIDFSQKIVEIISDDKSVYVAKRGDISGRKQVYRNWDKFEDIVTLAKNNAPEGYQPLLTDLIKNGKIVREFEEESKIRERVLNDIRKVKNNEMKLKWEI